MSWTVQTSTGCVFVCVCVWNIESASLLTVFHFAMLTLSTIAIKKHTEWTQLVLLLFARRQVTSTLHEVRDKTNTFKSYKRPTWQAIVLNYIKTYRQFPSISCVFPVAYSCVQLHSSCKFQLQILFTLGEAFAGAKTSKQILIRCQVSMIDELANVSPNGNRICNWNLQLECNCRKLRRRICNWKNTRSGSPCEKMVLFHYSRIAR